MTTNPQPIDRIPLAHSVVYAVRGAPEVPSQYTNGLTLGPTEITLTYRSTTDSQFGRVHAYVKGWWMRDGERIPMDKPVGQHYYSGYNDAGQWPEWLVEEARLHDPAAVPVPPPATRAAVLREAADAIDRPTGCGCGGCAAVWAAAALLRRLADEAQQPTSPTAFSPDEGVHGRDPFYASSAAEAQQQPETPECSASLSGNCLREAESETACDTEARECVHGGRPACPDPIECGHEAAIERVREVCDRLRRVSVLADGEPHTDRERGVMQAVTRVLGALGGQPAATPSCVAVEEPATETRGPWGTRSACRCPHPVDEHNVYGCAESCGCEWMPKRKPMDPVHILGIKADEESEADADTVANRAAQVITTMGADIRALTGQRDRYRTAWRSARERAQAYGEGILRVVKDREQYQEWLRQAEDRAAASQPGKEA